MFVERWSQINEPLPFDVQIGMICNTLCTVACRRVIHTHSLTHPHTALDADSQRTRVHEILNTMPRPNLKTLQYMVKHLHKIQQKQEVNKMTASNLAIVFWPTLMRPPLIDLADPSKQMGWQLAMTRIIEHPDFVP